jgi:hypothetical protein
MGSCLTKCVDPPFLGIYSEQKEKRISKKEFLRCKNMDDLIRKAGFFPIARIVSMKTSDKGVFPWDAPTIYPELDICVEDLYGMKKTYRIYMMALYRH